MLHETQRRHNVSKSFLHNVNRQMLMNVRVAMRTKTTNFYIEHRTQSAYTHSVPAQTHAHTAYNYTKNRKQNINSLGSLYLHFGAFVNVAG